MFLLFLTRPRSRHGFCCFLSLLIVAYRYFSFLIAFDMSAVLSTLGGLLTLHATALGQNGKSAIFHFFFALVRVLPSSLPPPVSLPPRDSPPLSPSPQPPVSPSHPSPATSPLHGSSSAEPPPSLPVPPPFHHTLRFLTLRPTAEQMQKITDDFNRPAVCSFPIHVDANSYIHI